jgi:hypothetical protein
MKNEEVKVPNSFIALWGDSYDLRTVYNRRRTYALC